MANHICVSVVLLLFVVEVPGQVGGWVESKNPPTATTHTLRVIAQLGKDVR